VRQHFGALGHQLAAVAGVGEARRADAEARLAGRTAGGQARGIVGRIGGQREVDVVDALELAEVHD
jgi:hypothetical protein